MEATAEFVATYVTRGQPTKWGKWYSTARWARIRRHQLREHPLRSVSSAVSSRRRKSATTSSHITVTSTSSGSALSSRSASDVTTVRSGSWRGGVSVPISALMGGLWTRRSTVVGGDSLSRQEYRQTEQRRLFPLQSGPAREFAELLRAAGEPSAPAP